MASVESWGWIAAVDRLPEGVAVFGCFVGLRIWRKTAEQMPRNQNCENG